MKKIKSLSIINIILFIGVVTVNALANILPINNFNTGELSDMIPNLFVPAGLTFSIWGVIYLLLAILVTFNVIQAFKKKNDSIKSINIYMAINFILNIIWILTWHYRLITLSLVVMLGIFYSLYKLDNDTKELKTSSFKTVYSLAIGVYFGWISVALIANITAFFVTIGWNGSPFTEEIWTILVIVIGAFIAIAKLVKSGNIAFSLVFIWAYIGIVIKRSSSFPLFTSIILTSYICIFLIIITIIRATFKKVKK